LFKNKYFGYFAVRKLKKWLTSPKNKIVDQTNIDVFGNRE
jgi:hypothetical protein